jgi:hypothetical protein
MRRELLLGAGHRHTKRVALPHRPDWKGLVTLDMDPALKPDILFNLNHLPMPFKSDIFDEIHAYEVLEHVGQQGDWRFFFKQWDEFARILKRLGVVCLTTPTFDSRWLWGDPGHTRYIGPESMVFLNRRELEKQKGRTPITDYRPYFTSDWNLVGYQAMEGSQGMVMQLMNK